MRVNKLEHGCRRSIAGGRFFIDLELEDGHVPIVGVYCREYDGPTD